MRQGVAVTYAVVAAAKIAERNPAGYKARSTRPGVRVSTGAELSSVLCRFGRVQVMMQLSMTAANCG
jgi:hypothetical protein